MAFTLASQKRCCSFDFRSLSRQFPVLRWGRWPRPWILRGDGGDEKWQKKVQVEEDPEKSDSSGELGDTGWRWCFVRTVSVWICFIFQGIVRLDHPCIHVDFPIVLCEVWEGAADWWFAIRATFCSSRKLRDGGRTHGSETEKLKCCAGWNITQSCGHGVHCSLKTHFDIHRCSDGSPYVPANQLWCRILYIVFSFFKLFVILFFYFVSVKRL